MGELPRIAPMLAAPGMLPVSAREHRYAIETKQDGIRAFVHLLGDGTLVIRWRLGAPVTAAYPELHALADVLAGVSAVLDGEIVALTEGRPDFERLQTRMGASPAKAARLVATAPVHLVLFDALHLKGRSPLDRPLADRRNALEDLGLQGVHWSTPAAVVGHAREGYELIREHRLLGRGVRRLGPGLLGITIKVVLRPDDADGFVLLPKRWVMERSNFVDDAGEAQREG
ncbi:hypothetical protein OG897_30455 [Streptomyces sp. NBC_00237]|uniref:ATP-dependent DNA ligase n=1 Tax=Streptomyces sp. NBC_00237 TaxID=2975687 RepID=UPI0022579986|nr:hypothetical protein [Streptomyces sp. NBC_00237]MCX5205761.1 hypothetical protein [Streptomyces sp. NBC_00237]